MTTTSSAAGTTSLFRHSPISLFAAGFISVLVFQMGAWSFAFWGGIWGLVYGLVERYFPEGPLYFVAAFLFGAILPVAVLWFVVFPLKGRPIANDWQLIP